MMNRGLLVGVGLVGAVLWSAVRSAEAHAFLDTAVPSVGNTVRSPPKEVRLHFTEALEPAFSTVEVFDSQGRPVQDGKARVDPADPTYLSVPLQPLRPGTYKVSWRVVSVDTHPTQGNFTFDVAQ